ncbi:MAG: hypothetical protein ACPGWR_13695 [Ardenticatenaceae bacterium]
MPSLITEKALARMRNAYSDGMMDTCVRMVRTGTSGNYGYDYPTYADDSTLSCLYRPANTKERKGWQMTSGTQVFDMDATLYLPRAATVTNTDRIRVTKMHGDTTTARTYEIVAGPVVDQVLQKVALKLVTDGSD